VKVDCGHADLQVWVNGRLVGVHVERNGKSGQLKWGWWIAFDDRVTASDYATNGWCTTWGHAYRLALRAAERTRKVRQ
jgi:hypothetical protein